MPSNPDKNHIAIQLISFPLKMQPPVHQWKADTVARQPFPGGWEVGRLGVGVGVVGRRWNAARNSAGNGWDSHTHLQNLHLCFNSQHKD